MTNKDARRQIIAAADEPIAALLFHQPRPHCLLRSRLSWLDLWCPFGMRSSRIASASSFPAQRRSIQRSRGAGESPVDARCRGFYRRTDSGQRRQSVGRYLSSRRSGLVPKVWHRDRTLGRRRAVFGGSKGHADRIGAVGPVGRGIRNAGAFRPGFGLWNTDCTCGFERLFGHRSKAARRQLAVLPPVT